MSIETAAILDEAANVIRRNGWTTDGDFHEQLFILDGDDDESDTVPIPADKCPVCTVGAIAVATGREPDDWCNGGGVIEAMRAVQDYLGLELIFDGHVDEDRAVLEAIGSWNDKTAANREVVIAALEGAARAEREAAS